MLGPRKAGPGRLLTESEVRTAARTAPLSQAEHAQRVAAAQASARKRTLREATHKFGATTPKEMIRLARRLGRSQSVERALYTNAGMSQVIAHQKGNKESVPPGTRVTNALTSRKVPYSILHNHPISTPLSVQDGVAMVHRSSILSQARGTSGEIKTMLEEGAAKTVPMHSIIATDRKGAVSQLKLRVAEEEAHGPIARLNTVHSLIAARRAMRATLRDEKAGKKIDFNKNMLAAGYNLAPTAHGSWKELKDRGVVHYSTTGSYGTKATERAGRRIVAIAERAKAEDVADWYLKTQSLTPFGPSAENKGTMKAAVAAALRVAGLFKVAPLTQREHAERVAAGKASAAARHRTAPSIAQGSTGAPSRGAIALFRQGQQRPSTRGGRGVWDTRATEPTVGSVNASFTFHFPKAYRSKTPDPTPKGRGLLAATLGARKSKEPRDLTITNPGAIAEAHRHPEMRELSVKAVTIVRDHQKGAIDKATEKGLIPEGTRPGLVRRAYQHAALLALHRVGLGDYDFKMDAAAKKDFEPLTDFMRFSHRRVFDRLNTETKTHLGSKWAPFREEFGHLYVQRKHGKPTGLKRMRMRDNQVFVKIDIGDGEPLEKAWDRTMAEQNPSDSGNRELERTGNKNGHNAHSDSSRVGGTPYEFAVTALRNAESTLQGRGKKAVPAHPNGDFPAKALHAGLHVKHAADLVERHLGLRKFDMSFMLNDSAPINYNANPATVLRRAIHPRLRRQRVRIRLNTQRSLRRVLGGGVTHQERWQIGATSRIPSDPFGKRYLPNGSEGPKWNDGHTTDSRKGLIAAARRAVDPTDAQAAAGNYRMGHARVGGFDVTIETAKGRMRRKIGKGGKRWSVRMPAHYGYIKRTEGADGDHVDVYLGPHAHEAHKHPVFVVDQQHADSKKFDEHKVMLGFPHVDDATRTYDAAFSDKRGPDRRGAVHEVTMRDFRHWVGNGDLTRPYGDKSVNKTADSVDEMAKGLIGAAMAFGARNLAPAASRGLKGLRSVSSGSARRLGAVPPVRAARAGVARVGAHPRVAPVVDEARSIGRHGLLAPVSTGGRLIGRAIAGPRGAKIGGTVGLAADYAPPAILAYQAGRGLLGHHDKEQRSAVRRLRSGTAVQQFVGKELGKGLIKGLAEIMQHSLIEKPAARDAGPDTAEMTALAERVRRLSATKKTARGIYTTGLKHAIREHWKVIHGGAPSPHVVAQIQRVREAINAKTGIGRNA